MIVRYVLNLYAGETGAPVHPSVATLIAAAHESGNGTFSTRDANATMSAVEGKADERGGGLRLPQMDPIPDMDQTGEFFFKAAFAPFRSGFDAVTVGNSRLVQLGAVQTF